MKNYLLLFGILSILSSCGKTEKETAFVNSQNPDLITQQNAESNVVEKKDVEKLIFKNNDEFEESKELDLNLLSKVAASLAIQYSDIKISETSFISYNDEIAFFVITHLVKTDEPEKGNAEEDDLGDYFERKYLFANKADGKIIAQQADFNLSYNENEGMHFSKSYILKNLIQLNENTTGVAFYTEEASGSRVSLYSQQKFTILALVNHKIKKLLYEYPIRKTQGDSNGRSSFELETLETGMILSDTKTNGFLDLIVSKNFSYEVAVEADEETGSAEKSSIKVKKESERIKYNGQAYAFKKDDRYRFLDYN
ncbi:hypothetical protein [Flavobacterium pectinovorum]|uniref:hypothetical protein n=1 Tax=Flavobacterium pectinovorum TaxID=29533 RepID=UPI001FABB22A|nr:hypothetical protein [Flavobacterium pectinovorum]MCI9844426.1 hypothetical protein [Flavobacterium pectinovorum]